MGSIARHELLSEVVKAARAKVRRNPKLEQPLRDLWDAIRLDISALIGKSGRKWQIDEVRRMDSIARLELLTAFVEGCDLETCGQRARGSVGL